MTSIVKYGMDSGDVPAIVYMAARQRNNKAGRILSDSECAGTTRCDETSAWSEERGEKLT